MEILCTMANLKSRALAATLLIGMGIMAAVDEIVFHQVLGWHHFYDQATPRIGLISDGFLHAAELIALVAGFFMYANLRARKQLAPIWAWSGLFLGAGGFQVFDGIINHKVLRLHQIRYNVDIIPYDVAWITFGILLIAIGAVLLVKARQHEAHIPHA